MRGSATAVSAGTLAEAGIDTRLLDCWETTLSLGLLAEGFRDIRTLLGAHWWFAPPAEEGRLPCLDVEPAAQRLERLTGLRTLRRCLDGESLPGLCGRELDQGRTPLVVTDAYLLPWCPYYGTAHVEHSFVVTRTSGRPISLSVVDAYDNRTEWGTAAPLETVADAAAVAAIEQDASTRLVTLVPTGPATEPDRTALLRSNISGLASWAEADPYAWFIERYCHADVELAVFGAFCEACWTIERRRALYAAWLDDLAAQPGSPLPDGFPERFRSQAVAAWSDLNRFTYLGLRRLRAGRKPAQGVGELVAAAAAAERALAAELTAYLAG